MHRFPDTITLTRVEAMDLVADLDAVEAELTNRGDFHLAFAVHQHYQLVLGRLLEGWTD